MNKHIVVLVDQHTTRKLDKMHDLGQLADILFDMGIKMEIKECDDKPCDELTFSYSTEWVKHKQKRDAGRRARVIYSHKTLTQVTVGEVKEMLKTRTQDDVAEEFNISRSTLIRRLRQDDDQYL